MNHKHTEKGGGQDGSLWYPNMVREVRADVVAKFNMKDAILEEGGDVLRHSAAYSEVRSTAQDEVVRDSVVECLLKVYHNKNIGCYRGRCFVDVLL